MGWLNRVQDALRGAGSRAAARKRHAILRKLDQIASDPEAALRPDSTLIGELVSEWQNEGWSALSEYAREVLAQGLAARGATLECGSGLTTLLLAVASEKTGHEVLSLEHTPSWAAQTRDILKVRRGHRVRLELVPIGKHGECDWYQLPGEPIPALFHLVVCDGPPGDTRGGRAGLIPAVGKRLAPGCVILLDDAGRDHERELGLKWRDELRAGCELVGAEKPYYRLTLPG